METDIKDHTSFIPEFLFDTPRLHQLLSAQGIGVWEVRLDTDLVSWDDQCKQLFGIAKENNIPYNDAIKYIHEEDLQAVTDAVQMALNGENEGKYNMIYRTLGADDGKLRWVNFTGQAYFDESGKPFRFAGIARDITEVKTNELLRISKYESERRFQNLIREATVGIILLTGREMKVEIVNEAYCKLIDRKPEELIGRNLFSVIPEAEQYYLPILEKVRQTSEPICLYDTPYSVTKDGEAIHGYLNVVYQRYDDIEGGVTGVLALCQDVTEQVLSRMKLEESESRLRNLSEKLEDEVGQRTEELKQSNLHLQQSNADLQQFAHVASHDLKEPVRKIKTFSNRLYSEKSSLLDEKGKLYIEKIQNATERMASMIDGVLNYSTVSATHTIPEDVNIKDVICNIEADLELVIQETGAKILYDDLPVVQGARVLLYQLFYNLINNSIKFSKKGHSPVVSIKSEKFILDGKNAVKILINDNGIGFHQKFAKTIFNTFTRLNPKDQYEGTGLGLALCKKIVERHHGSINADSVNDQGSTFNIVLPLKQVDNQI